MRLAVVSGVMLTAVIAGCCEKQNERKPMPTVLVETTMGKGR